MDKQLIYHLSVWWLYMKEMIIKTWYLNLRGKYFFICLSLLQIIATLILGMDWVAEENTIGSLFVFFIQQYIMYDCSYLVLNLLAHL